jgi:predicted MFS family arabinose efflux permease
MPTAFREKAANFLNKRDVKNSLGHLARLELYFCLAYLTQGVSQHFCLIAQPFEFYLMKDCGLNAAQVSQTLALLMFPWVIKPAYGLFSDCIPWLSPRLYLVFAYALAAEAFLVLGLVSFSNHSLLSVVIGLVLATSFAMAFANTLSCGLTVKEGNETGTTTAMFGKQAICYYAANILSLLLGGSLCQVYGAQKALPTAAVLVVIPCFLASWSAWRHIPVRQLRDSSSAEVFKAAKEIVGQKRFWLVILFICLWNFSPALGTPLYFFESSQLAFSQAFIGKLAAINAFGMLLGAWLFRFGQVRLSQTKLLAGSIIFNAGSVLAYVFLGTELSAVLLELARGIGAMFACLSIYTVASAVCPKKAETTAIAFLISIYNLAGQAGTICGGQLYQNYCQNTLWPLLVASAGTTLLCLFLLPKISESR